MAHIRKLPNGRYEARYRGPDQREHCKHFSTRRDAQAFLDQLGVDRRLGTWRDPRGARMLLRDWTEQWQATSVDLRASTRARDDSYLRNHVLPEFGDARLGAITPLAVRKWVAELTRSGLAPATVQKAYQTLSKILRAAVDADLIAQSPCRRVPLPRIEREEMRFLSPDEIAAVATAVAPRYRALVIFDAYCGLRLSELAGLRSSNLDLERGTARVSENAVEVRGEVVWGAPKTRAGRRTVPIPSAVVAQLSTHVDTYVDDDPRALVFGGAQGGVLRAGLWRSRFWTPATRRAGLTGVRIHDLRHTAVALWIAAGANAKQIATWAGHTSVSVVLDRYGHLFEGHEEHVLARLDAFVESASVPPADGDSRGVPRGFRGVKPRLAIVAGEKGASDQGEDGGRTPTRTADLCRVKAAL